MKWWIVSVYGFDSERFRAETAPKAKYAAFKALDELGYRVWHGHGLPSTLRERWLHFQERGVRVWRDPEDGGLPRDRVR